MNPGTPPFYSFPSLQFKASEPNLGGSRNLSLRLLIVLLGGGGCLGKADKEKKQVNLKAGLLILLEKICTPGVEPRGTREHTGSETKVKQPAHVLSVFKSNVFRGWRTAMSSSFPQSYCCHLSSLHISYWLSSKGDETLRFHISPPYPKRLPALNQEEGELCKGPPTWGSYSILFSFVPGSPNLLIWSQGPKGIRVLTTEWKL